MKNIELIKDEKLDGVAGGALNEADDELEEENESVPLYTPLGANREESLNTALRRFKRQGDRSQIITEQRKREHYEKPSVKRKKKAEAARKRKY